MKPRTTKPRKPKNFLIGNFFADIEYEAIWVSGYLFNAFTARKLAAWLNKAADYLESKDK